MNTKHISILSVIGLILAGSIAFGQADAAMTQTSSQERREGPQQGMGTMGTVTAISGTTITMTGKGQGTATAATYTVNASSATVTKNGETSSVSAITVGENIIVEGTTSGTTITAKTIRIGLGQEIDKNSTKGTVTAISGTTITMTGKAGGQPTKNTETATTTVTYTVDASKATVTEDGKTAAFSDIAVGDTIMVKGTTSGTTITATSISIQNNQGQNAPEDNGQPVVTGTVKAISGTTLTVSNKNNVEYTVDVSTAKITKKDKESTASNIAVGDTVIVQGTFSGTTVTATTVADQGAQKTNIFTNIFNAFRKWFKF